MPTSSSTSNMRSVAMVARVARRLVPATFHSTRARASSPARAGSTLLTMKPVINTSRTWPRGMSSTGRSSKRQRAERAMNAARMAATPGARTHASRLARLR